MSGAPLQGFRLLVGVCGSIAAYKTVHLVRRLVEAGAEVRVVMSGAAVQFVTPLTFETVSGHPVMTDLFSGPPNAHIEWAESADLMVVAPATANLLARHANGMASDALSTVLLALRGPLLLAPAMDGGMWEHPATQNNVNALRRRGVHFVGPESGFLASGLSGVGRMAEVPQILAVLADLASAHRAAPPRHDLDGEHVLVTAGATREYLDPVRYLSNPSTGRMGFAVAAAAALRGAQVTLIAGPTELATPQGVERVDVVSARQMHDAVHSRVVDASVLVMAAAVSDFRPAVCHPHKVKKAQAEAAIGLEPTADILKSLMQRELPALIKVGFAAETERVAEFAREKLQAKGLDLVVANDVGRTDSGFATDTNRVILLSRDGGETCLPTLPKAQVAGVILDRLTELRGSVRNQT